MTKLRALDLGFDTADVMNNAGRPLFKPISVSWSTPTRLTKDGDIVLDDCDYLEAGYLYAIVRNHGNAAKADTIRYIGITNNLETRFRNHPKMTELRSKGGETSLSIGTIDFGGYRTARGTGNRRAIEELEHIFIWTLWHDLLNDKKQLTAPGMGKHRGRAWDITMKGYQFSGQMPKRIIYPWIVTEPRRDKSSKS